MITATLTSENNFMIDWMKKNSRDARDLWHALKQTYLTKHAKREY